MQSKPFQAVCLTAVLFMLAAAGCSSTDTGTTVRHEFRIEKTAGVPAVDGRLDESFWKRATTLDNFRIDADPDNIPAAGTTVKTAYDDKGLYVAFICEEPELVRLALDGAYSGDFCELLTFSRPETPYYSPFLQRLDYMNANNAMRTQRRFAVTVSGSRIDSNIYKTGPHTPYITDDSWEGAWESAVSMGNGRYTVEMAVPWETIGGMPAPGHTFKLHFVRHRSVGDGEWLTFNWAKNENLYVVSFDPAEFTQEHPQIFAPVVFDGDHAVLTRYVGTEAPWKVERNETAYESLLTAEKDPYRAAHFYLSISGFLLPNKIREAYDSGTWAAEERNFITEIGRAGMNGPFLPRFLNQRGTAGLDSLYDAYGMRFIWHGGASAATAVKQGANIMRPNGSVAFIDLVYSRLKREAIAGFLKKYGTEPWLFDVRGQDEPFNQIATILQPGMYETVDADIRKEFGVGLGVPIGIPNVPYQDQPVHEISRGVPDHETALSRIAIFRWLNRRYADLARQEYETVKANAPNVLFEAYNRNAVADMDFLDQSLIHDVTDYVSADPYPSFCIYVYGAARSRYHVGFTSKFVTDLAAGKPTQMIVQGCDMIQHYSTPENVREWASQAAKAGVSMIDWWGTPRLDHPDLYREMLRISRLWMDMPKLAVPETHDIAVLFSDDSRVAAGDEGLHAHYTLHVTLGEKLGAWYNIVSENHVRRGLHTLEGAKLIIAPELAYVSREFSESVAAQVRDGATLVVLDPGAFTHDIETGPLADIRKDLLGLGDCPKRTAARMLPTRAAIKRFGTESDLPLRPVRIAGYNLNARTLEIPDGATVLYNYGDGQPAAFARKYGTGEVIVFGAMPFEDSELAIFPNGWDDLFAAIIDRAGIERGLPIWDFMLPETGGEVETFGLLR